MKLVVRAFVLGVFAAGAAGAAASYHNANALTATSVNHQVVTAGFPMPGCGPSGCTK